MVVWVLTMTVLAAQMLWRTGTKVVVNSTHLMWSSHLWSQTFELSKVIGNDATSRRHDVILISDGTRLEAPRDR
jgi:hypothetical protein